jgi:hypothetical protein
MRRHRTGVLTAFAMLLVGLHVCSVDGRAREVLGELTAAGGEVQVDKVVSPSGTTLREGDVIATGSKSGAIFILGSGTWVSVAERTEVALPYGTSNARLELRQGGVVVQTGSGQVSQVNTKFATSIMLEGVDGFPALCRIAAVGSQVGVLNDKGRVQIQGGGAPMLVPPGKYVLLHAGQPPGGLEAAGKVIAAIPTEVVERQGAAAVLLNLNDPLYWQDLVRTEKNGRVRIELTGGSVLNIGARSQMRIVKNDAATEQTELELGVGKFRGQIVKLTKPGASFKMKTQTAVVGVVGTDVVVVSNAKSTTVYCVDGKAKVCRKKLPASCCGDSQAGQPATHCPCCGTSQTGQYTTPRPCCGTSQTGQPGCETSQAGQSSDQCPCCVVLLPGQLTTVPADGPPTPPVNFSPDALQAVLNQVAIQAGPGGSAIWNGVIAGVMTGVMGVIVVAVGSASGSGFNNFGSGMPGIGCGFGPPSHQSPSPSVPSPGPCP